LREVYLRAETQQRGGPRPVSARSRQRLLDQAAFQRGQIHAALGERGPALRRFEQAASPALAVGECATLATEEFGFQVKIVRSRGSSLTEP